MTIKLWLAVLAIQMIAGLLAELVVDRDPIEEPPYSILEETPGKP